MEKIFTFYTMEQWTGVKRPVYSLKIPSGVDLWKEEEKWMLSRPSGSFYDYLKALGCTDVAIEEYVCLGNG